MCGARNRNRKLSTSRGLQDTRFILKKGLHKLDELGYAMASYGKKDGLRSSREEPILFSLAENSGLGLGCRE
jgi:hypothetical protein